MTLAWHFAQLGNAILNRPGGDALLDLAYGVAIISKAAQRTPRGITKRVYGVGFSSEDKRRIQRA